MTKPLTRWVQRRNWGLVKRLGLPPWLEVPITLILLDYLLYLWHAAFHKMPFLWRFHQVHHVDLDMDASTAIRFHFGEIATSTALQMFENPKRRRYSPDVSDLEYLAYLRNHVPRFERGVPIRCRALAVQNHHHSAHARDSSQCRAGRIKLQLVQWSHGLGLVSRHAAPEWPQNHLTLNVAAFPDTKEFTYPKLMEIPFEEQQRYPPSVRPDATTPRREEIRRRRPTVIVPEANKNLFPSSPVRRIYTDHASGADAVLKLV